MNNKAKAGKGVRYDIKAELKLILGFLAYYLILQGVVAAIGTPLGLGAGHAFWLQALDWLLILLPAAWLLSRLGIDGLVRRLKDGGWLAVWFAFVFCWWLHSETMLGYYYLELPFGALWLPENGLGHFATLYTAEVTGGWELILFGLGFAVALLAANVGAGAGVWLQQRLAAIWRRLARA